MTRDHAIRIAVGSLRGKEREDMIYYLLQYPEALKRTMGERVNKWNTTGKHLRPGLRKFELEAWASRRE